MFTQGTISGYKEHENMSTTTIRISEELKSKLNDLGKKTDSYEIILKRLVCLHTLVKERDSTLIEEAQRRAEAESK